MSNTIPGHQKSGWASGVKVKVLDMCWCNKRPLPKRHEPGCARERQRRGLK